MDEKERALFEAWWSSLQEGDDGINEFDVAWWAWQAARAPLLARLVEAEKDTARLDWVEAQGGCGIGYQNYDYRHHVGYGMLSLRELCDEQLAAIDKLKGE